ncbi:MAG: sulfite exporter TauE/SafE family protein [Deltaproteobacteria bacterium]|nr:sulfite exporter TauE/SafE family protein [Deltaproteobacteria bacterium]MBN2674012.1 sulfite exporter TauE/SafE family protein [Deltaproteobacteria bacterium]
MAESTTVLIGTAITIALMHTLAGPDHYLPFIILGRSEKWSLKKILSWTALCGAGHVLSSVLIGTLGIALGWNVHRLQWLEGLRGNIAVWALIAFGFVYMCWGILRGIRGHHHSHSHPHSHPHDSAHTHSRTFWALFTIFILGPCEPLIPMLMFPAASHSIGAIVLVAAVFSAVTILTMIACVLLAYMGFELFEFKIVQRYVHAFSGFAIGASGLLIMLADK